MGDTETHHFYDFGISGRVHDSQNQLFIFGDPRPPQISQERTPKRFFENVTLINLEVLETDVSTFCKRWAENTDDPSKILLQILDMGLRSPRKHEMEFW